VSDLIDEFICAGVVDLGISGGEPLLRKDLYGIIAYAREHGLSVGLGSNGTTLNQASTARLAALGLNRLQVSLDGLRESHDRLRCWPGLFDKVLRAIQVALNAGLRTHVCCTINRLNGSELEEFTELVSQLGVHRINFSRYVPTGRGSDDLDLGEGDWQAVMQLCVRLRDRYRGSMEIVTHLAQQILVDEEVNGVPGFIGCQAGIGQGCVTATGTVLPCVLLPVPVGNVREQSFREIWRTSPVIRCLQARRSLEGACGACSFRGRCGGCRALAYAKAGSYLATDPRCWLPKGSVTAA
jgi:radical SAM protein with 4Fe4S-binding SPASM domain